MGAKTEVIKQVTDLFHQLPERFGNRTINKLLPDLRHDQIRCATYVLQNRNIIKTVSRGMKGEKLYQVINWDFDQKKQAVIYFTYEYPALIVTSGRGIKSVFVHNMKP